ncbi:P-II family nitrogen regulator [Solemya velum gill symbiont]|uniref:Nitrogen regulatory protein n=1 Tax=Solemya velum gill symbiont TaxID=2340 RepID=A0A0B0H951_SOVGS|nr:P-II family nitrogen regulator [Solemya velum gill symbiont]KHF24354.1 nitrogen regulatory protein [Solemya velum gill symbiont]OOY35216.1 transcriptional regulator [Solemya velum gill symbiont]OOY37917.1 transcriptional regulator [Solemya velum gill symbiont]OOY42494.1 transcriptional regulator [Solemya velum gill symbiont]OOY42532.1 transcriptional regulator [Solemya velum gill symbiont]
MHFKLLIVLVEDEHTDIVLETARELGATGATVLSQARGEGIEKKKTFMGLSLSSARNVILLLVEEHMSRRILETVGEVCEFDDKPGTGIAFQIDVEDAVGVSQQINKLASEVEERI